MSLVTSGLLVSFSGIIVVCLGLFNVLPNMNPTMQYVFIGIGWVFIILGMIVRFIGMRQERRQQKKK